MLGRLLMGLLMTIHGRHAMKLDMRYTVDGRPILGTYVAGTVENLALVKDVGMNVVIGGHADLDPTTPTGKFCRKNGIKIMHHMVQHVYGKPRLGALITAGQTTIPVIGMTPQELAFPDSGVVQIDDELIRYAARGEKELLRCERGYRGTRPASHHEGIILFYPDECAKEVEEAKGSPNLWGYYVLDDSPGDALSALRAMYRIIKRIDPAHPVCAGYGSAGSLVNFGPDVCDIMLIYWYPVGAVGYERLLTSHQVQWMMASARAQVPGVAFAGIYQTFDAAFEGSRLTSPAIPTAEQVREQMEDFVREGACGLISFLCGGKIGWAMYPFMQDVLREAHREILATGGLTVAPEPEAMRRERVQPTGFWETPRPVPGVPPAWHVVAPFVVADGTMLDATLPPDAGIDLDDVYEGKSGPIRWIPRPAIGGVIGLGELFGPQSYTAGCVAYATCTVTSPRKQRVRMRLGSDDDALVRLNGVQMWRHDGTRGVARDSDIVAVTLPAGESRLVMKVYNRGGMWGFALRFTDLGGKPVDGLTFSPAAP